MAAINVLIQTTIHSTQQLCCCRANNLSFNLEKKNLLCFEFAIQLIFNVGEYRAFKGIIPACKSYNLREYSQKSIQ